MFTAIRRASSGGKRRAALGFEATVIDDLLAQLPGARATWVLVLTGVIGQAFAFSAFACDRLGHRIISPLSSCRRMVVCSDRFFGLVLAIGCSRLAATAPPS